MGTFVTSDTHFQHRRIVELSHRPYPTIEDMNEDLIRRWNSVVGPDDTTYHLGDFSLGGVPASTFRRRLNGRIHLIVGNHDDRALKEPALWESISDILNLKIEGQRVTLCHFAMLTWLKSHSEAWHLHGHSHGSLIKSLPSARRLDVGVDDHGLTPLSWAQVGVLMAAKTFEPVDHHGTRSEDQ